jgi:hypothetical protein
MTDIEQNVVTSDQIPDDPLAMPPPYWRGSGAIFQIMDALQELTELLSDLVPLHDDTQEKIFDYFDRHLEPPDADDDNGEFGDICDELWILEHRIKMKAELAIFMSAVQAEDDVNRFCVFNIIRTLQNLSKKSAPPRNS